MFIKKTKAKEYEYIKLVESYRENGKTKHRVLYNFGRLDVIQEDKSFVRAIRVLNDILNSQDPQEKRTPDWLQNLDLAGCAEIYNYGYLAYKKLWYETGISDTLEECQSVSKVRYEISETAFLMAVQHLLDPRSKLGTFQRQRRYINKDEIFLQNLYRTLDKLSQWKEDIEDGLFQYNYVRVGQQVDVVFYDVTTVYFESVIPDSLKDFGFSKDCKFNEVQVVMGMLIDTNGLPVGYELFPGNTFDGKTMVSALSNIKKRFGIHRVIIVADRGLNSKGNLTLIKDAGYGYIMASKIKSMSGAMKTQILSPEGFIGINDESGEELFRYKALSYTNAYKDEKKTLHELSENLIVSYSVKRAAKDKKDRDRLIEKAKDLLETPEKINASLKRGGRKYLNKKDSCKAETWELAHEKINQDSVFDGYYGIQTSEKEMSAPAVMEAYHTLWKIEESFRIMKSTLEIRPVFHWTPERIKGHFMLCFLAFLMERRMESLLKTEPDDVSASPDKIQEALNSMTLTAVPINGERIFFKTKPNPLGNKIFKLLKLKTPPCVGDESALSEVCNVLYEASEPQLSFF